MDVLNNASLFLIATVFNLYIFIVMLRIMLQWVNTEFTNPVFQFVVKLTNLPLRPVRHIIPTVHGVDLAAITLLVLLEVIKLFILFWVETTVTPTLGGLIVIAFAEILKQIIQIFFYALIALAVLSWFSPLAHSPAIDLLHRICYPLLRPIQRFLPPVGGFDLSPLPVLIFLHLLIIMLVNPLMTIGKALALG
jgi:YggT family protein